MSPYGQVAVAAAMAALAACASSRMGTDKVSADIAAYVSTLTAVPIAAPSSIISDFDAMRAALPGFDLERGADMAAPGEVSVVRDLVFDHGSSILSRVDVARLEPLHAYLRANPLVAVRIKGYGDRGNTTERAADLSLSRAHAVARALLTDMKVANDIAAAAAPRSEQTLNSGRAEIIFIRLAASPVE